MCRTMDSTVADSAEESSVTDITKALDEFHVLENQVCLSPKCSDSDIHSSRWLRVRDSLEGIAQQQQQQGAQSETFPGPQGADSDPHIHNRSPRSDSLLANKRHLNLAKIFMWDPWNKIGRKAKKDKGRKKACLIVDDTDRANKPDARNRSEGPSPILRRSGLTASETGGGCCTTLPPEPQAPSTAISCGEPKCVRFQRDVRVVYFAGDQVLRSGREPLRREQDQQERNKELRGRELGQLPPMRHVLRKAHSAQDQTAWK